MRKLVLLACVVIIFVPLVWVLRLVIGPQVNTPVSIPISSTQSRKCSGLDMEGSCACVGPDEIHWQMHAYDRKGYRGVPFAVNDNAECLSATDDKLASTLDMVVLYAVSACIALGAVYLINRKWRHNV